VEVATPLGRVDDVGTQFEVRLMPVATGASRLRLRVREGEVRVETARATHHARAGQELLVDPDGGAQRASVAPDDGGWAWAARTAPELVIEGRTLATFLDQATRELGLRWRMVEPGTERPAAAIVLHGSVAGLTPEEAIDVVLTGSGLTSERRDGELRVSVARR
jgi:hypothetical protein